MLNRLQPAVLCSCNFKAVFGHSIVGLYMLYTLVIRCFNVFFSISLSLSSSNSSLLHSALFSIPLRSLVLIFRAYQANQGRGARWVGR